MGSTPITRSKKHANGVLFSSCEQIGMSRKGHPDFCGVEQKSEMIWVNSFLRDSGKALAPSCVRRPVGAPIGALEKNFGKIRELSSLLDR